MPYDEDSMSQKMFDRLYKNVDDGGFEGEGPHGWESKLTYSTEAKFADAALKRQTEKPTVLAPK